VHQALSCTKFAKIEKQAGDRFENWELSPWIVSFKDQK
jgi:hypothetical protein